MRAFALIALTAAACTTANAVPSKAKVGAAAPEFSLTDVDGKTHTLSDYKDKVVVIEWFNPGCPFVVAAHGDGPLATMASSYADKDVVWLAVNSGAPGKQGHGVKANKDAAASWNMSHPILVDEDGAVGRLYGAKTTPQMVVVGPKGMIQYAGALDNAPRGAMPKSGYKAFTQEAVDAVLAGKTPSP
ncbi:MAG: redoxin family protein [Myxococcota bacterium]